MTDPAALVSRLDTLTVTAAKKQVHTINAQLGALLKERETES